MRVLIGDQVSESQWEQLLAVSPFSSPFQTIEFLDFSRTNFSLASEVFAIIDADEICALCVVTFHEEVGVKALFSRRAIVYGGPILLPNVEQNVVLKLFETINEFIAHKVIYIEIRNLFDYSFYINAFTTVGYKYTPWLNFRLSITNISDVKSSMSSSRLRQIKKSIKQGVSWRRAVDESEIIVFYSILRQLYLTKIKKPLFSVDFFIDYFRSNLGVFLLVYYEDKIIGGIVCAVLEGKSIYEFYVCGLDAVYKEQYPSVMATWAAIEYGYLHGIQYFDFMGAGSPNENYGVREFKARFGGELVENGRFLNVRNPILYFLGRLGLKLISMFNL